jgi:hypothetical protein
LIFNLLLKIAVVLSLLCWLGVSLYLAFIVRPQIKELRRKMQLPEFAGSFHYKTMEVAFQRLLKASLRVHKIRFVLGIATAVVIAAAFLR